MRARLPLILGIAVLAAGCQQPAVQNLAVEDEARNFAPCVPDEVTNTSVAVAEGDNTQTGGC